MGADHDLRHEAVVAGELDLEVAPRRAFAVDLGGGVARVLRQRYGTLHTRGRAIKRHCAVFRTNFGTAPMG